MQRLKKFLPFILLACLLFCLCACGRGGDCPQADDVYGDVTAGTQTYRGFVLDNVYHSPADGDIHFNLYIPASYDGSQPYALYITLPGYEGCTASARAQTCAPRSSPSKRSTITMK